MTSHIERLLAIMARLRDPERGCPWDREQTFATIAPYTIEEAYEVADAIERQDLPALRDELGDLLFQVVFHAQMAAEQGEFSFDDVAAAICDKMERRHPHVFGDASVADAAEQTEAWEKLKREERAARNKQGILDDVPVSLPALTRAAKLGKRASQAGFDWPEIMGVLDKIQEEVDELRAEIRGAAPAERIGEEIGDLLFAVTNLCRHVRVDPETVLRATNARFVRRFQFVEQGLKAKGQTPAEASLEEMDALWMEAKREEKRAP
jgi:tetrapyrrole methylase family protein/MazG family protein/ATP diphosphatase